MRHCLSRGALSLVAPALFLLFWHYASLRIDNAVVLPKIEEVLAILLHPTKDLLNMGSLIGNVTVSFVRVFGGYLLAVFVAVPLGLAMGYWSWLNRMLGLLAALSATVGRVRLPGEDELYWAFFIVDDLG